jgi:tRNA (adenine57-N1/adenine58-N1)-methyltransferase
MPTGHLHTFEFNQSRVAAAREEFERNGMTPYVTVRHRDVCADGFQVEGGALDGKADAVFLDLPAPWLAVPHAARALRADGALCSFSPCIEQVARTCEAMRKHGFNRLYTCEALVKAYSVFDKTVSLPPCAAATDGAGGESLRRRVESRPNAVMKGHTSFLTFARKVPVAETEDEVDMARREAELSASAAGGGHEASR